MTEERNSRRLKTSLRADADAEYRELREGGEGNIDLLGGKQNLTRPRGTFAFISSCCPSIRLKTDKNLESKGHPYLRGARSERDEKHLGLRDIDLGQQPVLIPLEGTQHRQFQLILL